MPPIASSPRLFHVLLPPTLVPPASLSSTYVCTSRGIACGRRQCRSLLSARHQRQRVSDLQPLLTLHATSISLTVSPSPLLLFPSLTSRRTSTQYLTFTGPLPGLGLSARLIRGPAGRPRASRLPSPEFLSLAGHVLFSLQPDCTLVTSFRISVVYDSVGKELECPCASRPSRAANSRFWAFNGESEAPQGQQ
jgi:hypothetical protein